MKLCYLALLLGLVVLTLSDFADAGVLNKLFNKIKKPKKTSIGRKEVSVPSSVLRRFNNLQPISKPSQTHPDPHKMSYPVKPVPKTIYHPNRNQSHHNHHNASRQNTTNVRNHTNTFNPNRNQSHHNPHNASQQNTTNIRNHTNTFNPNRNQSHHNPHNASQQNTTNIRNHTNTFNPNRNQSHHNPHNASQQNTTNIRNHTNTFNPNRNQSHHNPHNSSQQNTTNIRNHTNTAQSQYPVPMQPIPFVQQQGVQIYQQPAPQAPSPSGDVKKSGGVITETLVKIVDKVVEKQMKKHVKPTVASSGRQNVAPQQQGIVPVQSVQLLPGHNCELTNTTVNHPDQSHPNKTIIVQQFTCYKQHQLQPQPAQPSVPLAPMNTLPENRIPRLYKANIRTSGSESRLYSTSVFVPALITFVVAFYMHYV